MSDEPGTGDQDAQIRALLAELGSGPTGESMAPEVAARLDDTLTRLVAEREGRPLNETDASTVHPSGRRWSSRFTAAAAAVAVLGAGGVAAASFGLLHGSPGDGTIADGSAGNHQAIQPTLGATSGTPGAPSRPTAAEALPHVSSISFAADVAALVEEPSGLVVPHRSPAPPGNKSTVPRGAGTDSQGMAGPQESQLRSAGCPGPRISDGGVPSPVLYDGNAAVLVVHPLRGGSRLVEAWSCAGDRRLASTSLTR